jgi:hypothetical protein
MFGNNVTLPRRRMDSYAAAFDTYSNIKPIRGRDTDTRPLGDRRNDNFTIRKEDNNIVVRLYSTDVVVYHHDSPTITLTPYPSVLTNRVVNHIMPHFIRTYWQDRHFGVPDHITYVSGRYYNTPESVAIDTTSRTLVVGDQPMEVPYVDKVEAKRVRDTYRFDEFSVWITTLIRLGSDPRSELRYTPQASSYTLYDQLRKGPEGWLNLVRTYHSKYDTPILTAATLRAWREQLYRAEGAFITKTVPFFTHYKEMAAAFSQMRKYA